MLGISGESIITVAGEVDLEHATEICSRVMFDDALGFERITLQINARSSDVFVATSLIDTLNLCGAQTRAVVSGAASGTLVSVVRGCDSSSIFPHAHLDFELRRSSGGALGRPPIEMVNREVQTMMEGIARRSTLELHDVQDLFDRGVKVYGLRAFELGLVDVIESREEIDGLPRALIGESDLKPNGLEVK